MLRMSLAALRWQLCTVVLIVATMGVLNTTAFADSSLSSLTLRAGLDKATYSNGSDPVLTVSVVNNGPAVAVDWTHMLILDFSVHVADVHGKKASFDDAAIPGEFSTRARTIEQGEHLIRQGKLSTWGYRLGPGSYKLSASFPMNNGGPLVHSNIVRFTIDAPAVAAPQYRVELIAPSTTGAGDARAVNAAGDVAGVYKDAAFVWHAGHFRSFPAERSFYLGDSYRNIATAINASGIAAGVDGEYTPCSMSGLELTAAVTYDAHGMHFVDPSRGGSCSFEADGINDRGTIVGENGYRGFIRYADGHELLVEPLSTRPEDNGTRATALDNENHVVGGTTVDVASVPQVQAGVQAPYVIHAFLLTVDGARQRMRDLGALPGFPDTIATAINEDLTVVGYSGNKSGPKWTRVSGPSHAWVWQRGRMTDLGRTHSVGGIEEDVDSYAYGVNDAGVIVGCSGNNAVRWVDKHMQNLNALIDRHSGWHLELRARHQPLRHDRRFGRVRRQRLAAVPARTANVRPFRTVIAAGAFSRRQSWKARRAGGRKCPPRFRFT